MNFAHSPWFTVILLALFIILLLLVWRTRERSLLTTQKQKTAYGQTANIHNPELNQLIIRPASNDLDNISDEDIEKLHLALEEKRVECKDVDPLVSYYSREYKNRWRQVKPHINAVGFTPIAKRCAYPGAPCEWQSDVNKNKNELLRGM